MTIRSLSLCSLCGWRLKLVPVVPGAANDIYEPCPNCGNGASEFTPVTEAELQEVAVWLREHKDYERPMIMQRMYHIFWLAMRARGSQVQLSNTCIMCGHVEADCRGTRKLRRRPTPMPGRCQDQDLDGGSWHKPGDQCILCGFGIDDFGDGLGFWSEPVTGKCPNCPGTLGHSGPCTMLVIKRTSPPTEVG